MADAPYWEISGPRRYLNIPIQSPDYWRAAMTYGQFPNYKTVVGWGATEDAAKEAANEKAEAEIAASTQTANKEAEK